LSTETATKPIDTKVTIWQTFDREANYLFRQSIVFSKDSAEKGLEEYFLARREASEK
jgi:hypothetical protein